MAPHHEDRERHGSHPLVDYEPREHERFASEDTAERLEIDRGTPVPAAIAWTWQGMKELAYVVGGVLTAAGVYYGVVGEVRDSRKDIEALTARVVVIEQGRSVNLPRLEEALRMNGLQDQRIQNLTEALASLRLTVVDLARAVTEQGGKIADAHEQTAILSERIGRGVPHDR